MVPNMKQPELPLRVLRGTVSSNSVLLQTVIDDKHHNMAQKPRYPFTVERTLCTLTQRRLANTFRPSINWCCKFFPSVGASDYKTVDIRLVCNDIHVKSPPSYNQ